MEIWILLDDIKELMVFLKCITESGLYRENVYLWFWSLILDNKENECIGGIIE